MDDLDDLLARGEGGAPKPKEAAAPKPAGDDLDALLARGEAPSSRWDRAVSTVTEPFKAIGRGALAANDFATRAILHPVDTFGGGKALPTLREGMRGVNDNIPFANRLVEKFGGVPAFSPEDAATAPGARSLGDIAGLPVGGMVGGIAAKGVGAVARGVGGVARTVGEGAIERSAARGATPIRDVVAKAGTDLLEHGHTIAPTVRIAATAADETAAAIARRLLKRRAGVVAETAATEAPVAPVAETPPPPVEAPPAAAALSDNPRIRMLQEALPTATPAQAEMITKAIEGLERRAAAPPRAPMVPEAGAGPVAERAAAIRDARSTPVEAPPATPSSATAPRWTPSPVDERFARSIGLSVEKYREMMDRRNVRLGAGN